MSGQWEVVGKPKKTANGSKPKLSKTEKKKFIENAPKIEDILPLAQVKSLYTALDKEKKPKQAEKNDKVKEDSKKHVQKKTEKPKEVVVKPQKPKSIESALAMIDVGQVESVMSVCQSRFADSPLIWLKEIATYLNSKLTVDINDPVFTNRPIDYPLSAVPALLHKVLQKLISLAGSSNCTLFYELCLTNITNEMSKGSNALGYKIFAQLLAFSDPKSCIANLAKSAIQRNSYQNRPPIGQSLLWALGKGGVKDLTVGLKVWLEIMVPVMDMKNYSKFVIEYLSAILGIHESTAKSLPNDLFIKLFDVLNAPRPGLPRDLVKVIQSLKASIKNIMFKHNIKDQNFSSLFPMLLKRFDSKLTDEVKSQTGECLVKCLYMDPECFSIFRQNYTKYMLQSAMLMEYIDKHWNEYEKRLGTKRMQDLIKIFQTTNDELSSSKKREEGLQQCIYICHELLEKMSKKKQTSLAWKITRALLVVFLLVGIVVAYDVTTYKSFETSLHGQVLTKTGLLPLAEKAGDRFLVYSARGYKWAERNLPEYYNHTVVLAQPYLKLAADTALVGKNVAVDVFGNLRDLVRQKTPIVVDTINHYAPGFLDTIQTYSVSAWTTVSTYCSQYFDVGREYLKTNVFVGQLSPENLQKVTLDAFNTTQQYASQYYSWLYEKVNTYSKLQ